MFCVLISLCLLSWESNMLTAAAKNIYFWELLCKSSAKFNPMTCHYFTQGSEQKKKHCCKTFVCNTIPLRTQNSSLFALSCLWYIRCVNETRLLCISHFPSCISFYRDFLESLMLSVSEHTHRSGLGSYKSSRAAQSDKLFTDLSLFRYSRSDTSFDSYILKIVTHFDRCTPS